MRRKTNQNKLSSLKYEIRKKNFNANKMQRGCNDKSNIDFVLKRKRKNELKEKLEIKTH